MARKKSTSPETEIPEAEQLMEEQDYGDEFAGTPSENSECVEAQPEVESSSEAVPGDDVPSPDWSESDAANTFTAGEAPFPDSDNEALSDAAPPMEDGEPGGEPSAAWDEVSTGEPVEAEDPEYAALLQEMSENGLTTPPDDGTEPLVLEDTEADGGAYTEPPAEALPSPEPDAPEPEEAAPYTERPAREPAPRRQRTASARPREAQRGDRILTIDARDEIHTKTC